MRRDEATAWSGALAVAGVLGGGLLAVGLLMAFVGGYLLVLLFWGIVVVGLAVFGIGGSMYRLARALSREAAPSLTAAATAIQRTEMVAPTGASLTVRVIGVQGVCPLGLQVGSIFGIRPTGQVVPRLCRPALEAIGPLLATVLGTERASSVACACPFGDRLVQFSVYPAELAA